MQASSDIKRAEKIYKDLKSGDYEGAIFQLKRFANEGDYSACTALGSIYESDFDGFSKDYAESIKWYKRAIQGSNHPLAIYSLGRLYYAGLGVDKNHMKALELLHKIESEDQPVIYYLIGMIYSTTKLPIRDLKKAEHYLRISASKGHLLAKGALGRLFIKTGNIFKGISTLFSTFKQIQKLDDFNNWRVTTRWVSDDSANNIFELDAFR